jgi:hypothetical protein
MLENDRTYIGTLGDEYEGLLGRGVKSRKGGDSEKKEGGR